MSVRELDALPADECRTLLTACCGAREWVAGMLASRPWRDRDGLLAAADHAWAVLTAAELADAIAHHPRLGESSTEAPLDERARQWSAGEQSGAVAASNDMRTALARGNAEYERRFGHTFIFCASGRSAEDMLKSLHERLAHDPDIERAITARELHRITRLRLEKLLEGERAQEEAP